MSVRAASASASRTATPPAPLALVPTDAQYAEFVRLLCAAGVGKEDLPLVAQAHTSGAVWCELRAGANGAVARVDYTTAEVVALGDDWAADAVGRLTQLSDGRSGSPLRKGQGTANSRPAVTSTTHGSI